MRGHAAGELAARHQFRFDPGDVPREPSSACPISRRSSRPPPGHRGAPVASGVTWSPPPTTGEARPRYWNSPVA